MKKLFPLLSALGLLGFILSFIAHMHGLLERPSPFGNWAWALHAGIFPLFFPLVFYANKTKPDNAGSDNVTHLIKELPAKIQIIAKGVFGYALLNFALFIYQASKYPPKSVPDWLTQRGFSGHWMIFYSAICIGFWALHIIDQKNENHRDCPVDEKNRAT